MADSAKPAAPAEAAEVAAPSAASTEKQSEPLAPQSTDFTDSTDSTDSARQGLEATTEQKHIDHVLARTPGPALDDNETQEPMPPVAPQPAVGVESLPTEASQKASDAVPITNTSPSSVPTLGHSPSPAGPATGSSAWPETAADHPLTLFFEALDDLVHQSGHDDVYGVKLSRSNEFHTKLILQKFLRANANDLDKAKQQLLDTLKWRKDFDPTKAARETLDRSKFHGLGYIIEVDGVPESKNKTDVVTFNIYGAVKDNKATFGDLDAFLRWRVGLMERSIQKLNLSSATAPIPNFGEGPDPYQGFQVHDYLHVSFLRQDPLVKAATKKTIEVLGRYYPETLSRKFFVNVPVVMGWLFNATKLFIAKETVKKFTVLSYGNQLANELGQGIPTEYGGTQGPLNEVGEGMQLAA
ncbi:Non-classical phosphatidylinositol transfer protein (PITP) [Ascochyta rabiei]|uniref:Phosphatidylinositol transfer protein SFH5 n=1 Tax=Didymella rabiei TaxID=5454 RepID=A0A163JI58_DIDRA|nr:Non-classical phosphatidylinositol transfer protein (PITP) [Ascochyta rabiei]KZM26374.1 lipid transport [Ascochyta rabiei]UPX14294.1 Non-classical phosphatidylinositol transfer protein (PITP) [Ascochyta rabiei]